MNVIRRRWKWIGAAAIVMSIAVTVAAAVVFCGASLHPYKKLRTPVLPESVASFALMTVSIEARDGARLEASFVTQPGTNAGNCVMVLHGIGDSRAGSLGFAPLFLNAGYAALFPDSRAHGTSGGSVVTYGLLERDDVRDWAAWLRKQNCKNVFGLGESLGAGVLIQAVGDDDSFDAIVAECSYSSLRSIGEERVMQISSVPRWISRPLAFTLVTASLQVARIQYGLDLSAVSPLDSIRKARTPVLLIHGLADGNTPHSHSLQLAAANPNARLWLVPDAAHTGAAAADPAGFKRRVLEWFARHQR